MCADHDDRANYIAAVHPKKKHQQKYKYTYH